jgi:hypothetical protein
VAPFFQPDPVSVRDKHALAKLPAEEQEAWRKLSADRDALFEKITEAK